MRVGSFSKNDVIANLCIVVSGSLVFWFDSRYPDIVAGIVISALVLHGGVHIIRDSQNERNLLRTKRADSAGAQ